MRTRRIAVIGGGFSGIALATALLRRDTPRVEIALFEASDRVGRGVAYGTSCDAHVLNTRAGQMSLHADEDDHFVRWCRGRGIDAHADEFLPRRVYGDHVAQAFADARRNNPQTRLDVYTQTPIADL